jgi:type VI secretion system protein VasI
MAAAVNAQEISKELAQCSTLEGDLERLECMDRLSRSVGSDRPSVIQQDKEGQGKWQVETEINPVDDSTTVTLMIEAESGTSAWGEPITLMLRCQSGVPDLYIIWHDYLGDKARVLMRIGTARAHWLRWSVSTDWTATFYPRPFYTVLRKLLEADRVFSGCIRGVLAVCYGVFGGVFGGVFLSICSLYLLPQACPSPDRRLLLSTRAAVICPK